MLPESRYDNNFERGMGDWTSTGFIITSAKAAAFNSGPQTDHTSGVTSSVAGKNQVSTCVLRFTALFFLIPVKHQVALFAMLIYSHCI